MTKILRYSSHPEDVRRFNTDELRERFLIPSLMKEDEIQMTYTLHDRMMVLGVKPVTKSLEVPSYEEYTKASYLLERREMGIINVGGSGTVVVDGISYQLGNKECLYIGKGAKSISFSSSSKSSPAEFYINSCPAHQSYPIVKATLENANKVELGSIANSNERVIYQYIHEDGIKSCQLVMGFTELKTGNVWNTFPPHTHIRRMEVYFYFDLAQDQMILHLMGEPNETRHIVMRNQQAVISPEWSIHSGAGTSSYSFIWSMAGENQAFTDMDAADMQSFK